MKILIKKSLEYEGEFVRILSHRAASYKTNSAILSCVTFWEVALLALSPPKPSGLERCGKRQVLTKHPKWKIGGNFFEKKISKCPKNGEKSKKRRKKRVFSGYFPAYGGNRWNFLLLACNFWRQRFFNRWTFFEKTPHFAVNAG